MHLQTDGIGDGQLSPEDSEILRAQAGDADAFAPLMRRHHAEVLGVASRHAPMPHQADDLASETFIFAWQNLARFRVGTDFGSWLRSIAWQLCRARREREQCRLRNLDRYAEHCRVEEARKPWDERAIEILDAVAKLPAQRRQLVMLCDYEGRSGGEAASLLGRTPAWVRITLHRTRKELRASLSNPNCQKQRNEHSRFMYSYSLR